MLISSSDKQTSVTAWGFVATMQLFAINKASYYAFRAMLGLTESGFIAGCVYYLSTIYTRRQLATRASLFWVGSYIGKGSGGLMAAGIFTLGSKSSLKAWQWLFLSK